jgi:hypothetical protein
MVVAWPELEKTIMPPLPLFAATLSAIVELIVPCWIGR